MPNNNTTQTIPSQIIKVHQYVEPHLNDIEIIKDEEQILETLDQGNNTYFDRLHVDNNPNKKDFYMQTIILNDIDEVENWAYDQLLHYQDCYNDLVSKIAHELTDFGKLVPREEVIKSIYKTVKTININLQR